MASNHKKKKQINKILSLCAVVLILLIELTVIVSCTKKTNLSKTFPKQTPEAEVTSSLKKGKDQKIVEPTYQEAFEEKRLNEELLTTETENREWLAAKEMFLAEDIYFEFNSSRLSIEAQSVLKRKAEWLREYPKVSVIIEGHCDERGANDYNLALGIRRAEVTKLYLNYLGIEASRLTTTSYGEERPMDTGHNEEAWARNRRAHFAVEK